MTIHPSSVPDFDDLPKVENMPQGYAWGIFDKDGEKDLIGTLNFLTPEIVQAASKEVKDGISVSLNWPLDGLNKIPLPGRKAPEHSILYNPESMGLPVGCSWDDVLSFNTQSSSQWDSLCHFQHQPSGQAYNGFRPTRESLAAANEALPTLDHWHQHGGLVARGVLIDFKAYMDDKKIPYHAYDGTRITVEHIEACAAHQNVQFKPGDVLLVRTGATEIIESLTPQHLGSMMGAMAMSGIHGTEDTARWIWNRRFAAVASDNQSFEALPALRPDGSTAELSDLVLHPYLLAGFGMSIGELWDLSRLSRVCREKKRYSFMITSVPLHHPALVGSPPNALAIL